jgi:hypothetical protein
VILIMQKHQSAPKYVSNFPLICKTTQTFYKMGLGDLVNARKTLAAIFFAAQDEWAKLCGRTTSA